MGDRALAVWLGTGFYHFTAYSRENPNLTANMANTGTLDG
jgi:hypothetical protein